MLYIIHLFNFHDLIMLICHCLLILKTFSYKARSWSKVYGKYLTGRQIQKMSRIRVYSIFHPWPLQFKSLPPSLALLHRVLESWKLLDTRKNKFQTHHCSENKQLDRAIYKQNLQVSASKRLWSWEILGYLGGALARGLHSISFVNIH